MEEVWVWTSCRGMHASVNTAIVWCRSDQQLMKEEKYTFGRGQRASNWVHVPKKGVSTKEEMRTYEGHSKVDAALNDAVDGG